MIDNPSIISNTDGVIQMKKRISIIGYGLLVVGLVLVVVGGIAYGRVRQGYDSLHAFSAAQNVTLSYNDNGQLIDRGKTENADAIMKLLTEDWKYPVNKSDLNPNDPVINTGTEYMYQMATIAHHVLDSTQTVTLDKTVEYKGKTYEAGTYKVPVDGRYWSGFDRMNPIDGPARSQAWSGTVHGLFGELGVGAVTASTLQMGMALSGLLAGLGLAFAFAGGGLVWATKGAADVAVTKSVPEVLAADPKVPQPAS